MWIMMLGARLVSLRLLCTCGVPALLLCLASCASFAEGVTKGLVEAGGETEQRLACEITGPAFDGLEATMARQETARPIAKKGNRNQTTKVMLVHGMGSPEPGYSTRLQHNLTRALGLTVTARRPKEIKLRSPKFHGESLGSVTVWQYLNDSGTRELLFYELNWSEITEQEKQALAYDTSGQYSFKRARFNQYVKQFLNTRISDPVIYTGRSHARILESVVQGSCWMFYTDWEELPDQDTRSCDWLKHAEAEDLAEDEYIYITHSMGSRIVVDTLQQDVEEIDRLLGSDTTPQDRQTGRRVLRAFQDERIRVYMLANQLPLMQLGRDAPQVVGEIDEYCRPGGQSMKRRFSRNCLSSPSAIRTTS